MAPVNCQPADDKDPDRLIGWKSIAAHLGVSPRTAIRWAKEYGLPVARLARASRPLVHSRAHDLDAWLSSNVASEARLTPAAADEDSEPDCEPAVEGHPQGVGHEQQEEAGETEASLGGMDAGAVGRNMPLVATALLVMIVAGIVAILRFQVGPDSSDRTLPVRVAEAARGIARSSKRTNLELGLRGTRRSRVVVADGGLVRVETGKVRLGLHVAVREDGLEVRAYRLQDLRAGEWAQYLSSIKLEPARLQRIQVNGEWFELIWPAQSDDDKIAEGSPPLDPCCMVCDGFTTCAESVVAPCGQCLGTMK